MYKKLGAFSGSPSACLPHELSLFLVLTQVTCTQEHGHEKKSTPFLSRGYSRSICMVFPTSRALILQLREPMWGLLQLLILSKQWLWTQGNSYMTGLGCSEPTVRLASAKTPLFTDSQKPLLCWWTIVTFWVSWSWVRSESVSSGPERTMISLSHGTVTPVKGYRGSQGERVAIDLGPRVLPWEELATPVLKNSGSVNWLQSGNWVRGHDSIFMIQVRVLSLDLELHLHRSDQIRTEQVSYLFQL